MDKGQLKKILDVALEKRGDWAEIFIEEKETTGIFAEDKKIERLNCGLDFGAGIRLIANGSTAYAFTNEVNEESLLRIARVVAQAISGLARQKALDFTTPQPLVDFNIEMYPAETKTETKIARVHEVEEAARQTSDRIKQVSVSYADVKQKVTIANSDGLYVEDERIRTRLACNAVAADGGKIQTGFTSIGATKGFEIFQDKEAASIGLEAGKLALLMLDARPSPTGKMPVIMSAEAGGTMIHEACGHGLEADLVQKGSSVYAHRRGEMVASKDVTVIDEAIRPFKYGSYRYDDEGSPGRKNVLIDQGILKNYLYDNLTAEKDKVQVTGNGRRQSYKNRPLPRMSNTYLARGQEQPEEIIKSTKKGLYVKKMGGGQVNTTNGDYVFKVAEGYLIENGEITYPIQGATLTGNGPETLQMVEMVGNDLGFVIGSCGKEGQSVPVTSAQPTIKIKELIVGGIAEATSETDFKIRRI